MRSSTVVAIVVLACAALSSRGCDAQTPTPSKVILVHRHGARTPIAVVNQSLPLVCGSTACGALTAEGKSMLASLGRTVRDWYGSDGNTVLPPAYDPYLVYTRSTSVTRTIQSADAFLRGAFPNLTDFYPAIENVHIADDHLLDTSAAWPSVALHLENRGMFISEMTAYVNAHFTADELVRIGQETFQDILCPTYAAYCALTGQDFAQAWRSQGILKPESFLATAIHRLDAVIETWNRLRFGYSKTNPFDLAIGSQGTLLAQEILSQAAAPVQPSAGDTPAKSSASLIEFSAHDTTLMPLYATMGTSAWRPRFAEAILFEVYQDATDPAMGTIRAFWGHPEQTPGDHLYSFAPYPMHCVDGQGIEFINAPNRSDTKNLGCTLTQWNAYLETTAPRAAGDGWCSFFAPDQVVACPNASVPVNASTQPACLAFRTKCPATACGAAAALVVNYNKGLACEAVSS